MAPSTRVHRAHSGQPSPGRGLGHAPAYRGGSRRTGAHLRIPQAGAAHRPGGTVHGIARGKGLMSGRPGSRALVWLLFLAPFFFLTYNFANVVASHRAQVPVVMFPWERRIP